MRENPEKKLKIKKKVFISKYLLIKELKRKYNNNDIQRRKKKRDHSLVLLRAVERSSFFLEFILLRAVCGDDVFS